MTTDGAANERGAARLLVEEGNEIHCSAHLIQLAINDLLNSKQAAPPQDCAIHRLLIHKSHLLVAHINGHRDAFQAFTALAKAKASVEGERHFPLTFLVQEHTLI